MELSWLWLMTFKSFFSQSMEHKFSKLFSLLLMSLSGCCIGLTVTFFIEIFSYSSSVLSKSIFVKLNRSMVSLLNIYTTIDTTRSLMKIEWKMKSIRGFWVRSSLTKIGYRSFFVVTVMIESFTWYFSNYHRYLSMLKLKFYLISSILSRYFWLIDRKYSFIYRSLIELK